MTREILIKTSKCEAFLIEEMSKINPFRCYIGTSSKHILSVKKMLEDIMEKLNSRQFQFSDNSIIHRNGNRIFTIFNTESVGGVINIKDPTHMVIFGIEDLSISEISTPILKLRGNEQILILIPVYDYGEKFINHLVNNFKFNGRV